jgi:hypothetical protein
MILLDTLLDPRLWKAVAEPFQAGDYRTAIIDAIQFLAARGKSRQEALFVENILP